MKLTFLQAKNFLSFKNMHLPFEDQIIVVGSNNAGKSNLIRALKKSWGQVLIFELL
ncbi:MAG: AAA family ATPase [Candidatus Desulfofervidaceae bacterium]|nr:AAA family ATPase [Candidatus Desulfofervidaceae bacterium]